MKIIVIIGPTGVGKTTLSVELAKKINAEIINADATQVYLEASVGTAKITKEEMKDVPHHMLNVTSLKNLYTVKDYQKDARKILDNLIKKDKNVIIVGGSGLYIKALLYDYKFTEEEENITYDNLSNDELKKKVDEIYKENNIHKNNRKRLERFLSHYETTGEIIKNTEAKDKPLYNFTLIGLTAPRNVLYEKLDKRVEIMICDGLIEESRYLYNNNYTRASNLIGYKEFFNYFEGKIDLVEAVRSTKQRTRKYAKRQYTWIKTQFKNVNWFDIDYDNFESTIKKVEDFLNSL